MTEHIPSCPPRRKRQTGPSLRVKLLVYCWAVSAVFVAGMVVGGLLSQRSEAAVPQAESAPMGRVIIDAPFIDQRDKYPTGCESVTAVMALQYAGVDATVEDFIDLYLPKASEPYPDAHSNYHSVGPNEAFMGDPYTEDGWGCYAPVILRAARQLLADQNSAVQVKDLTGASLDKLWKDYVSVGTPVIVWATMYMRDATYGSTLLLEDGSRMDWITPEHCLLLVGADEEKYYFNDPLSGKAVEYRKDLVAEAYRALGMQAIVIEK